MERDIDANGIINKIVQEAEYIQTLLAIQGLF